MVAVRRIFFLAAIFACLPISTLRARDVADYRLGDKVEADIVTPVKLVVVDQEATAALKQQEAQQVPVICRFYPAVANEVEATFHQAFAGARSNFLNAVEARFSTRRLDAQSIASAEFPQVIASFQKQNPAFPLTANLAGFWARGESDEALQSSLLGKLRAWTKFYIRDDALPDGWRISSTVRVVPLAGRNLAPTMETADRAGITIARANLRLLSHMRLSLEKSFSGEEQAFAGFTAGFLRNNCDLDVDLSRQARAKSTDALWLGDTYEAGQIIVRRGEVVNQKILVALGQLREKTEAGRLEQHLASNQMTVAVTQERNRWLFILLGVVLLVAIVAIWKLSRRPAVLLLPARMDSLAAGEMVAPAKTGSADLRQLLAPQLARLLMNGFVRRLIGQRAGLMSSQEKVAAEIAELEARLKAVHAPLQERLIAYEMRIVELEKQLAARDEQNRALIKAKIDGIKKQLETERARSRVQFN